MIKVLLFATAARRVAGNWRHLWGRTGQIAALGKVGYYGFTTSEETKKEPLFRALFSCSGILWSYSVIISFTSVGRHFPKNMVLQSENPSR